MTKSEILCKWLCEEYNLYHCDFEYLKDWIVCKELNMTYKYVGDSIKTYDGRRIYNTRQLKKYLKKDLK